ncbi:hypothetical protein MXD81_05390 [Microbacteriaceae bacterium K1510]|nr:hypothetical protein [Microbacteriaceae bacterium K1510]
MTALFLANIKLVLLFALVGVTIVLSTTGQRQTARLMSARRPRRTASIKPAS